MKENKLLTCEFKFILTILGGLFFALIFEGCKTEININDLIDKNSPLLLSIGTPLKHTEIEVNSDKYKKLIQWSNENVNGWQMTNVSYVSDIFVKQGNFRLLTSLNGNGVVIGFTDKNGKPKQYRKTIKKGELDFLTKNDSIYFDEFYSILNELVRMRLSNVASIKGETMPVFKTKWGNSPTPEKSESPPPPPPVLVNYFDLNSCAVQIERKNLDSIDAKYMFNSIDSTNIFKIDPAKVFIPVIKFNEVFKNHNLEEGYNKLKKIYGSSCFISVSAPIFNSTYKKAILFINYYCGPLFGQGYEFTLEKKNGKWELIDEWGLWES